ncbi:MULTISPECIES: helix-turn-helix domain-containing protein [Pseudomonas]|uniref:Helix-turn-helix transcriptional regulator n=1 Tax=Pseudomonas bijieensis TaxID=2681983 RepID=A0A6N1C715_9PSED|nr:MULTISPECIES: helix-turn-helix transcriptional regulator [Pseudomonas]AXP03347.1 XRE family transcriptional regulator [Pseudomonas fluorescens]MCD9116627.1 helix-turn-helix domain-containing protein [Pseudomonas bijieensis]PWJ35121.1 transcriptional regulator with XRE-family HTH domain [Pseudomonas sp. 43mfcvi1.1]QIB08623.1 helix-turn-helix transcriptional regulator [Pseudomonas fluorescens]QKS81034.1 helix-turn-helix transcriptional regulator [Pseudomonas bijieensis]
MNNQPIDIALTIKAERTARQWSIGELAQFSGVSKAMISKIENAQVSPTSTILGRLSGAFGLPLSTLLHRAEGRSGLLSKAAEQPRWVDPETGYARQQVSPREGWPLELISVQLPPGVRISYPATAYAFLHQQVWTTQGTLTFTKGTTTYVLEQGDCLQLGLPEEACTFENATAHVCEYVIALIRK